MGNRRRSRVQHWILGVIVACISTPMASYGANIFEDHFESDLSQWTGQGGGTHHGLIVQDPLRSGNNVLTFTALNAGGDIYIYP